MQDRVMTAVETAAIGVNEVERFLARMVRPERRDPPRIAKRLREIRPDRVPTPHGTVAAWRIGTGPAVLLVHGFEDDHTLWEPMIDVLVERGRSIVVFDLPAHGLSTGDSGMGWEAAAAVDVLVERYHPIDAAVGHSIGACALIACLRHYRTTFERAVLVSTPFDRVDRWHLAADRFDVAHDVADRAREQWELRVPTARLSYDPADDVGHIEIPMLLVNSADDSRAPFADARRAAAGRRNIQLHAVNGLGHRRTARDPSVAAAAAEFVDATPTLLPHRTNTNR
jgi:pimeloyl-ACP methyl ester carboxylesterase